MLFFSIIQSVVGVGILLFGTPTLLFMGYSYNETLGLILPSSIVVSVLQIISSHHQIEIKKDIYIYTLPMIILGLVVVLSDVANVDIKKLVGCGLILIGCIRYFQILQHYLNWIIDKYKILYYMVMGIVHGVSNMGGGLLVTLISGVYNDKDTIRSNIAFGYLLFGSIQLSVLFLFSKESIQLESIFLAMLSLSVYLSIGRLLANKINEKKYQSLVTLLIFVYGILSFN